MVVSIRLARSGLVRRPIFNIVVAFKKSPRDGKHLEKVRWEGKDWEEDGAR